MSWRPKLQKCVALSMIEVEYITMIEGKERDTMGEKISLRVGLK